MTTSTGLALLCIEGAPRERGRIQGEALRPLIHAGMERWKEALGRSTGLTPGHYLDRLVAETDFLPAIERWAPALLEEVRGIAEAAGLSFRDVYAYQLMDEEWLFRARYRRRRSESAHHCSLVGFAEGEPTILAQNMDLPKYYDGTQTLLHVRDERSDLEALVFTPAGLIGTCGLNSASIGLCVNTLDQLSHTTRGLPVAFIARRVLGQRSFEGAVQFVQSVDHASGQNYAIGAPGRLVDFEASAGKVVQYAGGASRFCHTNHPLANDNLSSAGQSAMEAVFGQPPAQSTDKTDSEQRFDALVDALEAESPTPSVAMAKTLLSARDVPISVGRDSTGKSMTLGSLVMELTDRPVLHLAAGPPAETPYERYTFDEL